MAVPGQQWQQVAGGEQVRQQVFVQAPAQELLGLVDQPPALDVAADRGDHARYGAVEVAQPLRQRGGFTVAGDRGVDHGQVGDRKSVVEGQSVAVRVDLGGRRIIKKNKI